MGLQSLAIGVTADCGFGPDDDHFSISGRRGSRVRAGLYHADDRDLHRGRDAVESECGCSVAGNDQHLRPLGLEEMSGIDGIASDGLNGLRTVRQASTVAEVQIIGVRNKLK